MIQFFVNTNGPKDISFLEDNFRPLKRTLRLSGFSLQNLETILHGVCEELEGEGKEVLQIRHCLTHSLQGLIVPSLSAGAMGFDPLSSGEFWGLTEKDEALLQAKEQLKEARDTFQRARSFHEQKEEIYLKNMDFPAANQAARETISLLLSGKASGRPGKGVRRFFGAATCEGNLDYIEDLTEEIPKRFFIKGRPGTGKSTFLKKIARAAIEQGFETEIYHCSLDPKSLDMVAVRELGFCLLDSTAPHEYFPSREGDEIIDLYLRCVAPGTDERYREKLKYLDGEYKALAMTATEHLQQARLRLLQWEESLSPHSESSLREISSALCEELRREEDPSLRALS